jgi:hypothetical protein
MSNMPATACSSQPAAQFFLAQPPFQTAAVPPAPARRHTVDDVSQRQWLRGHAQRGNGQRCSRGDGRPQEQAHPACRQVADRTLGLDAAWLTVEVPPVVADQAMSVTGASRLGPAFSRLVRVWR